MLDTALQRKHHRRTALQTTVFGLVTLWLAFGLPLLCIWHCHSVFAASHSASVAPFFLCHSLQPGPTSGADAVSQAVPVVPQHAAPVSLELLLALTLLLPTNMWLLVAPVRSAQLASPARWLFYAHSGAAPPAPPPRLAFIAS